MPIPARRCREVVLSLILTTTRYSRHHPYAHRVSDTRKSIQRLWIVFSVIYGVFRWVFAWHYLEKYGVNPLIFGAIELSSSCGYAIYSGRLVAAAIDQELSRHKRLVLITITWFILPDAYIFMSAGQMPRTVIGFIVTAVLLTGIVGATAILRRTKTNNRPSVLVDA